MKEQDHQPPAQNVEWDKLKWRASPYRDVFVSDISESLDPTNCEIPLPTLMAVKLSPKAVLPPHYHKRGKEWLEKIEIFGGNYTILGYSEEKMTGRNVFYNDYLEIFGVRNDSDEDLYLLSLMNPAYTGSQENKLLDEWW